jgi:transcriptional regulator GlxA family with amidase domain
VAGSRRDRALGRRRGAPVRDRPRPATRRRGHVRRRPRPRLGRRPRRHGDARRARGNERLVDWIRAAGATSTWTTSVCTGALLLGAAGLLDGLRATTHWAYLDDLARSGAEPTSERVVEQGNVLTSAGVSSGIDMALTLAARMAGDDVAQAIQLRIEYDPEPPFDAGSTAKAPPHVRDLARSPVPSGA